MFVPNSRSLSFLFWPGGRGHNNIQKNLQTNMGKLCRLCASHGLGVNNEEAEVDISKLQCLLVNTPSVPKILYGF